MKEKIQIDGEYNLRPIVTTEDRVENIFNTVIQQAPKNCWEAISLFVSSLLPFCTSTWNTAFGISAECWKVFYIIFIICTIINLIRVIWHNSKNTISNLLDFVIKELKK